MDNRRQNLLTSCAISPQKISGSSELRAMLACVVC